MIGFKTRVWILVLVAIAGVGAVFSFPPVAQDPHFHDFADRVRFLGIPNFGNVISNLVFVVVGIMGLIVLKGVAGRERNYYLPQEMLFFFLVFAGSVLIGVGSIFYHWAPSHATLLYDRLPMAVVFMALFALVISDRIGIKAGLAALGPLVFAGMGTVLYWDHTEIMGRGDLRPYALVQFLPIVLIPLMFVLFRPHYSRSDYVLYLIGWYLVAKVFEHFDALIFEATARTLSGHTLKHLFAGSALYYVICYMEERRPLRHETG